MESRSFRSSTKRAEKYTIRRYQKRSGEFRQQSKFNISSKAQAQALIGALQKWIDEESD